MHHIVLLVQTLDGSKEVRNVNPGHHFLMHFTNEGRRSALAKFNVATR